MTWMMKKVNGNDGAERHEAHEGSAGDRRAIADADQAGQLEISGEMNTARTVRTPEPPTDGARMAHNTTHGPTQRLVPILCCESRTKFSAQTSCGEQEKKADTLPKFQTDYMFIRTVEESKTQPCNQNFF